MVKNLEKHGWIKRTTINEPRLGEIIKKYESLGFEVHLEPVNLEDLEDQCRKCYQNQINKFKTVYVRKKQ